MIRLPSAIAVSFALSAAFVGSACKSETESFTGSIPPDLGITCGTSTSAASSTELTTQLAAAGSGSCVVLSNATTAYSGTFDVPAGVSLVGQNGSRPLITGGSATAPAVTLHEGSQLVSLDVKDTAGVAIAVRAASAFINAVNVTGAKNAALAIVCTASATPGCASGTVTVKNTSLQTSALGLWVSGAHVAMTGGSSSNHTSTSLSSASGIVAQSGASLDLDGITVEKNQGVGILIDGATTKTSITNGTINENNERGLWAQKVAGSIATPAVMVKDTNITKNKIMGVGVLDATGIIVVGGSLVNTVAAPQVTTLATTEMVGDGFGIFSSADVKFDNTTIDQNERAAGVIDVVDPTVATGIIVVGGKPVTAGASGLKVVVQKTGSASVNIATSDQSMPATPLGVSAPTLSLPGVL